MDDKISDTVIVTSRKSNNGSIMFRSDGCENEPSTSIFKLDIIQNIEEIYLLTCH